MVLTCFLRSAKTSDTVFFSRGLSMCPHAAISMAPQRVPRSLLASMQLAKGVHVHLLGNATRPRTRCRTRHFAAAPPRIRAGSHPPRRLLFYDAAARFTEGGRRMTLPPAANHQGFSSPTALFVCLSLALGFLVVSPTPRNLLRPKKSNLRPATG
jgi:hypothetical protein